MKRRVVQHGRSTMIVSLPSRWIKQFGILKGDELELVERGNRLEVSVDKPAEFKNIEIDVSRLSGGLISLCLASAYKKGYDAIILAYSNEYINEGGEAFKMPSFIRREAGKLIGLEVTKEAKSHCIITAVSQPAYKEFENIARRIFLLLINQAKELRNVALNEKGAMPELLENNEAIKRLVAYCQRLLNKTSYLDSPEMNNRYHTLAMIELLSNELKDCASISKNNSDEKTTRVISWIESLIQAYYDLYFKFELKKAEEIMSPEKLQHGLGEGESIKQLANKAETIRTILHNLVEYKISMFESKPSDNKNMIRLSQEASE